MAKMKTVFQGRLFTIKQWPVRMPDGTTINFERAIRVPTVMVLPLDQRGYLWLTREYQRRPRGPRVSMVMGRVEKGESPRQAANRELQEEAGVRASQLTQLRQMGKNDTLEWVTTYFVATGLTPSRLAGDPDERIIVTPVPLTRAFRWVLDGTINEPFLIVAILMLYRERKKFLRQARVAARSRTRYTPAKRTRL